MGSFHAAWEGMLQGELSQHASPLDAVDAAADTPAIEVSFLSGLGWGTEPGLQPGLFLFWG